MNEFKIKQSVFVVDWHGVRSAFYQQRTIQAIEETENGRIMTFKPKTGMSTTTHENNVFASESQARLQVEYMNSNEYEWVKQND